MRMAMMDDERTGRQAPQASLEYIIMFLVTNLHIPPLISITVNSCTPDHRSHHRSQPTTHNATPYNHHPIQQDITISPKDRAD